MAKRLGALALVVFVMCGMTDDSGTLVRSDALVDVDRPPNVLVFVTDDQRFDTMDVMPSVGKWFGDGGTEYTNAFATTPLCCPSRASILTGRYAHNHHVRQNGKEAARVLDFASTLPAYLRSAGYETAMAGKYFNKWPKHKAPRYFDKWAVSGAGYYRAKFDVQGDERVIKRYATDFLADWATSYVREAAGSDKPWFLYVAPLAAHAPFTPEKEYRKATVPDWRPDPSFGEKDRSDKPQWVQRHRYARYKAIAARRAGQLRTLLSADDMVDVVMTALEETGQDDDTLAIFTSDNGFMWGEHGLGNKRFPYLPSVRLPLFLRWPAQVPGGVIDQRLAANIDLAPTILEAARVDPSEPLDGVSLLGPPERDSLYLEFESDFKRPLPSWGSIVSSQLQYTEYYSRKGDLIFTEYYDLAKDPHQLLNLLGDQDPTNDPPRPLQRRLERLTREGRSCAGASCHGPAISL